MKRLQAIISASIITVIAVSTSAAEPDMIVTSDGETIKVYNLDVTSGENIYYTLTEDADAAVKRIAKADVLIIKLADGTKLDPSAAAAHAVAAAPEKQVNPHAHEPVTHHAVSEFKTDKKGKRTIHVGDDNGQVLNMRVVPDEEKTLAVTGWDEKGNYERECYIIPEYVVIGEDTYIVKHIDENAFRDSGFARSDKKIKEIVFPSTLETIGAFSFFNRWGITEIVLPENLRSVGKMAFRAAGVKADFRQLYIPKGIREIGEKAFLVVGKDTSPRGFFQGNLTSIPDWITTDNCTQYGIDENAVEAYEKRQAIR